MSMSMVEFSKKKRRKIKMSHSLRKTAVRGCDCFDCYYTKNSKKLDKELESHPIVMPRKVRET